MHEGIKKGYYGIGVYDLKTASNIGTLWRSAYNFGADFIFTIGKRYRKQYTDTAKAERHIPLFEYQDFEDFKLHIPKNAELVFIEKTENARPIKKGYHPRSAIYILGAEDYGIPKEFMQGHHVMYIPTRTCLNVSTTASIIMYDRSLHI